MQTLCVSKPLICLKWFEGKKGEQKNYVSKISVDLPSHKKNINLKSIKIQQKQEKQQIGFMNLSGFLHLLQSFPGNIWSPKSCGENPQRLLQQSVETLQNDESPFTI